MSSLSKIGAATLALAMLAGVESGHASARRSAFPLALCGPELTQFCRLYGRFDAAPFRYSLAIHPGCIKWATIQTPYGPQRRPVIVCG